MNWVMRELGPVLTALPVGAFYPGRTAGPTFDIARPAIFMLPHQRAAWKAINERLDALQQACASLGQQAGLGALAPLVGKQAAVDEPEHPHTRRQNGRLTAASGAAAVTRPPTAAANRGRLSFTPVAEMALTFTKVGG